MLFSFFKKRVAKNTVKFETIDGVQFKFQKHHLSKNLKMSVKQGEILVTVPKYSSFKLAREFAIHNLDWAKANFKYTERTKKEANDLRKKAREILSKELDDCAKKYGFKYRSLKMSSAKRRWGSCSYINNINLNIELTNIPEHLREYVMLHELCHTKVKNHSEKFWDLMEKHMPDTKKRRAELKQIKL